MIIFITKHIKIIFVLIIINFYCSKANAKLQLGIDLALSNIKFKENFGGNIFSNKLAPGLNVFASYMFNSYIGGELGIEMYKKMRRIEIVPSNTIVAGVRRPNFPGYSESYKTTIRQKNFYIGLTSKYKITQNIFFNLLLGLSLFHVEAKKIIFALNHPRHPAGGVKVNYITTFSKTMIIPMLKFSMENKFNDNFGVRCFVAWKQTSLFKIKSQQNPTWPTCIKAKDSLNFGVGAIYYI